MKYQDFLCAVKEELNRKFDKGTSARVYETVKNNGMQRKGVVIKSEDSNLCPAIYLEEFYERYKKGLSVEQAVLEVMDFYRSVKLKGNWDTLRFGDFGTVKDKIVFKLINYAKNSRMLSDIPHIKILDLALIFYVLLRHAQRGMAAVTVRREHLKLWGTDAEELFGLAKDNAKTLLPARFYPMRQALKEFSAALCCRDRYEEANKDAAEDIMYVLTNPYKSFGAACMAYSKVLETVGNMLGEDFYILPSSIHEIIIVPLSKGISPEAFDEIIEEINHTQVEPEEVLSDHCYYYSREKKKILLPAGTKNSVREFQG